MFNHFNLNSITVLMADRIPEDEEDEVDEEWKSCCPCQMQFTSRNAFYMHLRTVGHMQKSCNMSEERPKTKPSEKQNDDNLTSFSEQQERFGSSQVRSENQNQNDNTEDDCDWTWCESCQCQFNTEGSYFLHIRGLGHIQKTEELEKRKRGLIAEKPDEKKSSYPKPVKTTKPNSDVNATAPASNDNWHYCDVCDLGFYSVKGFDTHMAGSYHAAEVRKSKGLSEQADAEGSRDTLLSMTRDLPTEYVSSAKQLKTWTAARDRDLTPDDLSSRSVSSGTYRCEVCNVTCTGIKSYNMHLEGQKHLKKSKKLTTGDESNFTPTTVNRTGPRRLLIQTVVDKCQDPLIGLDYVTEFQKFRSGEEPVYACDLCATSKMDPRQVINHVTGLRHRRRFLKFHHPSKHEEMCEAVNKHGQAAGTHLGEVYARAVQLREGRTKIRLKVELSRTEAIRRMSDGNLTRFDGSFWEEIGEDGLPRSRVTSGPEELEGYRQWTEGDTGYYSSAESDYTPSTRRPSKKHLNEDIYRQGLKRPSSEPREQNESDSKRLLRSPYSLYVDRRDDEQERYQYRWNPYRENDGKYQDAPQTSQQYQMAWDDKKDYGQDYHKINEKVEVRTRYGYSSDNYASYYNRNYGHQHGENQTIESTYGGDIYRNPYDRNQRELASTVPSSSYYDRNQRELASTVPSSSYYDRNQREMTSTVPASYYFERNQREMTSTVPASSYYDRNQREVASTATSSSCYSQESVALPSTNLHSDQTLPSPRMAYGTETSPFSIYPVASYDHHPLDSQRDVYSAQTYPTANPYDARETWAYSPYYQRDAYSAQTYSLTNPHDARELQASSSHSQHSQRSSYSDQRHSSTTDREATFPALSKLNPLDSTRDDRIMEAYFSKQPTPPWARDPSSTHTRLQTEVPGVVKTSSDSRLQQTKNQSSVVDNVTKQLMGATGSSSRTQAEKLLGKLTECMVTSEKDAELALQVSNALTKALAQYKIKTFLHEAKQSNKSESGNPDLFAPIKLTEAYFDGYSFNQKKSSTSDQQERNLDEKKMLADVLRKAKKPNPGTSGQP